ncbi:aspartyl protease [Mycena sanguinolenta]|nr:aspartyl protease [Mycena sanguinolenta]
MRLPPNPTTSRPILPLLFAAAAFCTVAAEPINIPISLGRRASAAVEHRRRYAPSLPNQRRATVPIEGDELDAVYYLTLSIGTPPQQFNFEIDLGSPYTWVANISCSASVGCEDILNRYDPSHSSSVTQISTGNSIQYHEGSVNVSGNFVKDAVRLTPFTVPSQFFLAANKLSADGGIWTSSGILGLAYQQTPQGPSFPMSLFVDSNGQLPSAEMSFWVNRMNTIDYDENPVGGAFTYGGTNSSLYQGAIEFLPTTAPSNGSDWNLDVKEIIVQGTSVQITPALSAFSLRSLNISGPASDVAAIWAAVPDAVPSTTHSGYYQFPCTTTVNVSISFGGRFWAINPLDMNIGAVEPGSPQCLGAIYTVSNATQTNGTVNWIFGTAFLKNVYSVFQPTPFTIGFAELSTQSSNNTSSHSTPVKTIVGAVVGGIVLLALCGYGGRHRNAVVVRPRTPEYAVVNVPTLVRTA